MTTISLGLWTAVALAAPPAAGSPNVAVVDIPTVHEAYARTTDLEAQFDARKRRYNDEVEARRGQLERESRALQDFKPNTPDFQARRKHVAQLEFDLRFYSETEQEAIERSLTASLRLIYDDIQAMVRTVALEKRIDIVIAADEFPDTPPDSPGALKNQILLRKVIYWSPRVDITDEVVARLNSEYAARQPKPKPQSARPVVAPDRLALESGTAGSARPVRAGAVPSDNTPLRAGPSDTARSDAARSVAGRSATVPK